MKREKIITLKQYSHSKLLPELIGLFFNQQKADSFNSLIVKISNSLYSFIYNLNKTQMSEEVATEPVVENSPPEQEIPKTNPSTFDQVPIGGGNKFQMSQYPSQNDAPPVKKQPPVRKPTKPKKEETKDSAEEISLKAPQQLDQIPVGGGNNPNKFDEKPIGKSEGGYMMSEFPEGQPVQAPATNYTMSQKLKSKAPKMRLSGMEDMIQLLTTDPDNSELADVVMSALLKQTTPANMQKSLQCLKAWMQTGKSWGQDEAKNAIQNGYINGKASSKKLTIEIVDSMYEVKPDMIQMLILVGFKNKTPKIIAGYNSVLNELLTIYGIRRMKYLKPYLPEVIRVIGAQKLAAVKTQGMTTLRQAYKWMSKEVVEPMLGNLKQALKKQLDTEWENYDKTIVMTAPKDLPQQGVGKSKGKKIDAYDLSEAVDIFKKYNEKWSESVIKAEKWNQKVKMMEEFVKAATVPKLANTQNRHIGEVVRRLINDANFNVVLWTLKIIAVMSKGLRKHFSPIAKAQFSNVISKFRQKRTQMVQQTFSTLNDINYCLGLQDVIQDVKQGFGDKAPQMKCNLMNWIGKHIQQKMEEKGGQCPQKTKDALKRLFPIFQKLLEDGVAQVRQTTAKNVAKLQLLLGEDFLSPVRGKVNKNLDKKIGVPKVQEKPQTGRLSKKGEDMTKSNVKITKAGDNKAVASKPAPVQNEKPKQQKAALECFDSPTNEQSLQTLIGYGLPQEQVKNINASTAADRGKILNYLRENPYENFNAVVRVIRKAFKDWKEINVPMNKDLISYLQERAGDIGKPEAYVLIPYLAEKLLQSKFAQQIMRIVSSICVRVPASFMIGHFLRYVRSPQNKKPKLNGQICSVLAKIIQLVSISNCNVKQISEYAKQTFNVNTTKKQAQELILCLYLHAGDAIKSHLDDNILKIMDAQFKNIKPLPQDQKKPKIPFEGDAAESIKITKKQSVKQDSKPRDLTVQVQKALPLMNDNSNWQKRKDGAQLLTNQLQFGGKVHFGNLTGDLIACLKVHINDTNKQLIKVFVHLAGLVLVALPQKDLKTCLKSFITALTEGLSDKNQQNRRQITQTLGRIGQNLGKEHLLNNFGPYLQGDKEGRLQVLNLILANQDGISRSDIRDYPKGLVNCLIDKNKDIRAAAEKVFEKVYQKLGLQVFKTIAKDQKLAVAKDLSLYFEKFDKNAGTMSSINSKGVSPGKANQKQPKPRPTLTKPPPAPNSAQKERSLSRGPNAKSFIQHDQDPHAATVSGAFFIPPTKTKVEGNEPFANKSILQNQRIQRQSNQVTYIWRLDKLQLSNQQSLCDAIHGLINEKFAKKLLSMDYTKVHEVMVHFMKLSKEINYQDHFRQLYDVFFKWTLMKLWGGQPAFCSAVIQLVFPILSILQKKKAILTDFQVDLVIAIVRQYFISASLMGNKISENVYNIIKCLVALSSGERVLIKILKQFSVDLPGLHRHLRKQTNAFYREGLSRAIKNHLANHVGTGDTMQQASKIKQLKEDPQFVNILFQRYRQDTLQSFGFKKLDQSPHFANLSPHPLPPTSSSHLSGSGVSYKPPPPPTSASQVQSSINNGSFVNTTDSRQKSGERLPKRGDPKTATGDLRPSQLPNSKPYDKKNNPSLPQIPPQAAPPQHPVYTAQSQVFQSAWSNPYDPKQMNLNQYPAPHPASPLSKHLNKLLPPNDSIITFFNTLFQQSGEKIANQLTSNAKIIFGQILKSVQDLIDNRRDHTPDKIVAQVTLLQSCIKCPHIIKNIGQLLGYGTSFALTQLVYEDQHKAEIYEELKSRNIEYKADNFIKAINGVMLRILENAHPHETVNVLLELLTYHSRLVPSSPKTISLVVKCLGRVAKEFAKELRPQAIRSFLARAHQFLLAIDYDVALQQLDLIEKEKNKQKIRPEDTAVNVIRNIIIELCTAIKSEIWEHYEKSLNEIASSDHWIGAFILSLNIKPIEKTRGKSQQSKDNQELKKINDLLSKSKSFEQGIAQLKKYTEKHPQFNAQQYFTSLNYDRKFIQMVIGSLDGQRRMPVRSQINEEEGPNENIQQRIRRLRERFQDLQPEGESSDANSMNRQKPAQQQDPKEQRALQIKRRIQQMKNKMNSAVRKR